MNKDRKAVSPIELKGYECFRCGEPARLLGNGWIDTGHICVPRDGLIASAFDVNDLKIGTDTDSEDKGK